ncbi:hypothetical protein HK097_010070 [Rhizophlyctis rosea]|uniref:Potassium transporter n=1 Tax=Rhizophlyctis rosea TaxID=64517 RepID=A0AAD5SAB2_9FUNG|nr:hypothetical protein HK097_010070 [Rhizophlyctis rosea]
MSCITLFLLLFSQRYGTSRMIKFYGPFMVTWFLAILLIGCYNIARYPAIFQVLSPHWIFKFAVESPGRAWDVLGGCALSVAGVEAMYADLGHFKTIPIRVSFLCFVYPALILNYLGQGAYLIERPEAYANPFFFSVPQVPYIKWPVLVLATLAAIIAAQATISGTFTMIDQGMSLHTFPNLKAVHLSGTKPGDEGSVYIPAFNNVLIVGTITFVLVFQNSETLANFSGIAISICIVITGIFYMLVLRYTWHRPLTHILAFGLLFLTFDIVLFLSTIRKVASGGWVVLAIAFLLFTIMYTHYATTLEINDYLRDELLSLTELRSGVKMMHRTGGTIVFVGNGDEDVPHVLNLCARRLNSLPMGIVCMSAVSSSAPFIADEERIVFRTIDAAAGIYRLVISYGYAERSIDAIAAVNRARKRGLRMAPDEKPSFLVGKEMIKSAPESRIWQRIRRALYDVLDRNTMGKIEYFNLPPEDTLEWLPDQYTTVEEKRHTRNSQTPDILHKNFSHFDYPFHLITASNVSSLWRQVPNTHILWTRFAQNMKLLQPSPANMFSTILSIERIPYRVVKETFYTDQKAVKTPTQAKSSA